MHFHGVHADQFLIYFLFLDNLMNLKSAEPFWGSAAGLQHLDGSTKPTSWQRSSDG